MVSALYTCHDQTFLFRYIFWLFPDIKIAVQVKTNQETQSFTIAQFATLHLWILPLNVIMWQSTLYEIPLRHSSQLNSSWLTSVSWESSTPF